MSFSVAFALSAWVYIRIAPQEPEIWKTPQTTALLSYLSMSFFSLSILYIYVLLLCYGKKWEKILSLHCNTAIGIAKTDCSLEAGNKNKLLITHRKMTTFLMAPPFFATFSLLGVHFYTFGTLVFLAQHFVPWLAQLFYLKIQTFNTWSLKIWILKVRMKAGMLD